MVCSVFLIGELMVIILIENVWGWEIFGRVLGVFLFLLIIGVWGFLNI